jgi:hypothetical protein
MTVKSILGEIGISIIALILLVVIMPWAFFMTIKEQWRYKKLEKAYTRKFQEDWR